MSPLGLPLVTCAAAITACCGTEVTDGAADAATIQSIDSYCAASWHRANIPRQDWDDCSQQTFVRLLGRVSQDALAEAIENARSHHRRELNRCIWATTQWWRRSQRHRSLHGDDVPDPAKTPQLLGVTVPDVQEAMRSDAVGLTATQRSVMELWATGHSTKDIASNLGVPSRRVSDEKYRAISKLRTSLRPC
jgi:DNA-directed RNA polymerase specialized sigma24 family protein